MTRDIVLDLGTGTGAVALADDEKRTAISVIADLQPERFVLGDVMLFGESDPSEPFYSPDVDDPATVGVLVGQRARGVDRS